MTGDRFEPQDMFAKSGNKIRKKVWIKASPDVIYRALTESKELMCWFCDRATCDARQGGELNALWQTGQQGRAVFTHLDPGISLELLWIDDGSGTRSREESHTLRYDIRSKSGMTELVMIDKDDSPTSAEEYDVIDKGWNSVLLELKDHCERLERSAKLRPHSKTDPKTAPPK